MKNAFWLFKLVGICAFLWVQGLQLDHNADQSLDNQHTNCLVCKSAGDPMASADAVFIAENIVYNSRQARLLSHVAPANAPDRSLLTHGPPALI
ncbi:hypothetical protein [Kordiimonas aquimaris]|uniref:hypothetical protein n=1 Tax=Kordiimonas aquimaris TaxID=707591 RepID=UPI0021D310D9|nr:hypothetical protein [Kordiimonas aquimaris]